MTESLARERLRRLGTILQGPVDEGVLAGAVALVARGDDVHVETAGWQDRETRAPMKRNTIVRIASMTKAVLAAAAMILVEEARIGLDDSVEPWLPELAKRRVLCGIGSSLEDTVPAARATTLSDLLTLRFGLGAMMVPPGTYPIQVAMEAAGLAPGPFQPDLTPDTYMERIGRLPLVHQPGERWLYHTGYDVLAVLIARIAEKPLEDFLKARLFEPLGMTDTGFHAPGIAHDRLATAYALDASQSLIVADAAAGGAYAEAPRFPSELVSTADDYLAFARLLLAGRRAPHRRILSRASVALMMTDQITPEQKALSPFVPGFWETSGWGFGGAVTTRREDLHSLGTFGWTGGFGTAFIVDPAENLVAILLTQRLMRGPDDMALARRVFALAYAAIED